MATAVNACGALKHGFVCMMASWICKQRQLQPVKWNSNPESFHRTAVLTCPCSSSDNIEWKRRNGKKEFYALMLRVMLALSRNASNTQVKGVTRSNLPVA